MNIIEGIACLVSNPELRRNFAHSPKTVAMKIGICPAELESFCGLNVQDIDIHAEILLQKKTRLVCNFLPITFLNAKDDLIKVFKMYSRDNWPSGHEGQFEDIKKFLEWVPQNVPEYKDKINTCERNKILFLSSTKKVGIYRVNDFQVKGRDKSAIQVLFFKKNQLLERFFFFSLRFDI